MIETAIETAVATPGGRSGPVAVVTGAASGMGLAVAERFVAEGWSVVAIDRDAEAVAKVAAAYDATELRPLVVDITDRDALAGALADIAGVGVVVNAAGIYPPTTLADYDYPTYRHIFDVNVLGTLNVIAETRPALRAAGGGAVINFASIDAFAVSRGQLVYSASKAAVVSLTQTIAVEWALANSGIRVLCVSPGLTRTGQATMRIESGAIDEAKLLGRVPLNRWITPDEIAAAIVSLTSSEFSALHGANVIIDAGYDAWGGHF